MSQPPAVDDVLLDRSVRQRLNGCGLPALRGVDCQVEHSCVKLTGRTRSYYLKQVAQELVRQVPGVREIDNAITVQSSPAGSNSAVD